MARRVKPRGVACVCEGGPENGPPSFFRVRRRGVGTLVGVMRLYAKLLSMILVFAAIQRVAAPSCAWSRDAWFAFRCQAAEVLGDDALAANLVDEYYNNNRRIDPELMREMEIRRCLASPLDDDDEEAEQAEEADEIIDSVTACAT